jgi:CRISPR type III-associated protein (TIGR04423 family)
MKIEKIEKVAIPDLPYEGYLWYSDQPEPKILEQESISREALSTLPFVVEGWLYNADANISIRISNIDGQYHVAKMDVTGIEITKAVEYHVNKDKFGSKMSMKIYQHHELRPDPINEGWNVLQQTWFAFVGFKK